MSTATLVAPIRVDTSAVNARPGLGRLVSVELRKMVNTRAGFWLQIAMVAITVVIVAVRVILGDAADHTFASVLDAALQPTAVLLPVVGVLLVTSEWSQRTGLITFALVPVRSRILAAKLLAAIVLSLAMLAMAVAVAAAGALVASPGVADSWSGFWPMVGQAAVFLTGGMITAVAFGAILLESAPALVVLFAVPAAWAGVASLSIFASIAPWTDTLRALGPLTEEVVSATQWAHAATALALWMALPLAIGAWRITRHEITA